MKKIALIVPTYAENPISINNIVSKYGKALRDDTYKHYRDKLDLLNKKIEVDKYFKMYVYLTNKNRKTWSEKGHGKVTHIYHINKVYWDDNNLVPCPDEKLAVHDGIGNTGEYTIRGWHQVIKVEKLDEDDNKDWSDFHLYGSGRTSKVQGMLNPESHWYYVYDEF